MFFKISIAIFFLINSIDGQSDCKCGGTYANGRLVQGCANQRCSGNATSNTRCVVIYREKTAIGYDCLVWPTQVADCATFDDGSRVCASNVCRPNLLGGFEGDCAMAGDENHHALVAAQISRTGIDFAIEAGRRQAAIELPKLKIPDQALSGGGFDLKASNIRVEQFAAPTVSYVLTPPSTVKIAIKGGDFKACAHWEAKAAFIKPSGDVCVWSKRQQGVDIEITVNVAIGDKGQLRVTTNNCRISAPIEMKMTGGIGAVISVLSGVIEKKIGSVAQEEGCKVIDTHVQTTLKNLLEGLPQSFKVEGYALGYTIQSLQFGDFGVKAQLATNGTFSAK